MDKIMEVIKHNTQNGQIYYGNKCLNKDTKGYYTISTSKFGKQKIQFRNDISDINEVERINNVING